MKQGYFSLLCLFMVLAACQSNSDAAKEPGIAVKQPDKAIKEDETKAVFSESENKKSKDSLLKNFEFKAFDFPYKTWYHKAWWAKYSIRDNALLCGLDSSGKLFLISNMLVSGNKTGHHSVSVEVGGRVFQSSQVSPGNFPCIQTPGTIGIQANIYTGFKDSILIQQIATHGPETIKVRFNGTDISFTLSRRDKSGITDCYRLMELISEKRR